MDIITQRAGKVNAVLALMRTGKSESQACSGCGITLSTYRRLSLKFSEAGLDGLSDQPRSGRPRLCPQLNQEEADYLRRAYLRSNLGDGCGSKTAAARWCAKEPDSPFRQCVRDAILKHRSSKHILPRSVLDVLDLCEAEIRRYRDPKSGQNDGQFSPGWLRMASDGQRLLRAGERQVWDDGSINFGAVVEWPRGWDGVTEASKWRLGRYQLLLGVDCQRDYCPGFSFVIRSNDAYCSADAVAALWRVWSLAGYAPDEVVLEGGVWQTERMLRFLDVSGVQLVSAKGRPNQKLAEGYFDRLWTQMSLNLKSGSIGRTRGENVAETAAWLKCRAGKADPRDHFPVLDHVLDAIEKSVRYLNHEISESKVYGNAVPAELYAAQTVKGHALPSGLRRFAMPVREQRKVSRHGMVGVRCDCPWGWKHSYAFTLRDGYALDGAEVTVSFDPQRVGQGAVVELARPFRGRRAGEIVDEAAVCVSPAPAMALDNGFWRFGCTDPREAARSLKRHDRMKIGARVSAFDERGVIARHIEKADADGQARELFTFGSKPAPAAVEKTDEEWAELERAAGVLIS